MDRDKNGLWKTDKWEYVLLGICILFYLLFPILDGPVWCVDSGGYVSMHITREPLYPAFLALCRKIAGICGADALMVAVILQSLLAGAAAWTVGWAVRRAKDGSRTLQVLAVLFQFAVTVLCRFAANRGSAYTDSILTEGLGLSLFVFFSVFLFLFIRREKTGYLCGTLMFAFLLVSLRKQMAVVLVVMGIVFAWYELIRRRRIRRFVCLAALIIGVFFAGKLFDRTYQYFVRGVWMEHSGNSMGILCTLLYSSDAQRDKDLFEDGTVQQFYMEIMRQADEQHLLYKYAGPGWLDVAVHFADSYDAIGYGIINPVIQGYISDHFQYSEAEAAMKYDEICEAMSGVLFRQDPQTLFKVYLYNTWRGLVNSIARSGHFFSLYAAAAYLFMGMAAWYLGRRKKGLERLVAEQKGQTGETAKKEREMIGQIDASLCFAFIVMAGIVVNALVVGLFIFAQPRYMIYGMGLFYTAGSMLVYDLIACFRLTGQKPGCKISFDKPTD